VNVRWTRRRRIALQLGAAACCVSLFAATSNQAGTVRHRAVPKSPWELAVQARETLEANPDGTRTRAQYTEALDAFRAIYHANPADLHAPDAVNAVAELLVEQGHSLRDAKSLRAAVGQYEFLRTQYPASPLRFAALLAEGQIDANDLHDATAAQERYTLFLKLYPKNEFAEQARAGIAALSAKSKAPVRPVAVETPAVEAVSAVVSMPKRSGPLAQVTGIRHWSTATYTRVAIDLGDAVTFEAARVPHPDRIYFDLHGAKLVQELVGKSFSVTDDGFLKRIRAAQSSVDVTRVVLDVNDVTEYSAFLLPNPYRLIIDIHGGKADAAKTQIATAEVPIPPISPGASGRASAAANASGLPAMAVTDGGFAPAPQIAAKPVPNTVAVQSASTTTEVAAVSTLPGRVEATSAPTSHPIATVVRKQPELPTQDPPVATLVPVPALGSNAVVSSTRRRGKSAPAAETADAAPARAADRTADGETSLIRALGLKIGRIVIDAGHGGHDSGTLGADGIQEKDVVLDVALRLGKMLHERLGAEIVYTRSDDTFIPLETRTAIANKAQADLFLSIHANSSPDASARGVETYYLNFTSDSNALDVAARENAVSGQSIHQLSDLVKKITLKDKIAESREFAADVETSLYAGLAKGNEGLKDRGVKKAPFVVLIGANMPSILAEISFVTNPRDAGQLRRPEYRERVAESLFNGVAKYEASLGGAKAPARTQTASIR
jgi:N-acetylmuramoyl-L-alanine amidase